jgi:D-amino peptidase
MRVYVICDLEGTAGVVDHRQQCWFEGKYYEQARRLATLELNALVEGALAGGATEIVAWDGHGSFPGGLDIELLHPECRMVMCAGDGGPEGLNDSYDAAMLLGFHGMAGADRGVLRHSFFPDVVGCWVNGERYGEIGANVHTAGLVGVPVVLVAGDLAACDEARSIVPEIETAVVKEGLHVKSLAPEESGLPQTVTVSLAPAKARLVIRVAARLAMAKVGQVKPFVYPRPWTMRTTFRGATLAEAAMSRDGARRVDEFTVEVENSETFDMLF